MNELTHKDLQWFRLANANPPSGFYEFKDRFLKRFATQVGWDFQEIEKECYRCDGSGRYCEDEECWHCGGTGIYRTDEHWLRRYDLNGVIYHKPATHAEVWHECNFTWPTPVHIFEGRIGHGEVDSRIANRAFYRLLIRHEPVTFYNYMVERIVHRMIGFRVKLVWKLIRLRNKMDLFKAVPDDDVPF